MQLHNCISLILLQELLRRSDVAQKNSLLTRAPPSNPQLIFWPPPLPSHPALNLMWQNVLQSQSGTSVRCDCS
jgi:hypothetical protein